MGKSNGGTRGSSSGSPKGLAVLEQNTPNLNRLSDIPANQLGYGGLTRDNSTYSKKDRDAYINANMNDAEIRNAASLDMDSIIHVGDILIQMDKSNANEYGNRKITYILSDTYNHYERVEGWDSNAVADVRRGLEKFLKAWPQRK